MKRVAPIAVASSKRGDSGERAPETGTKRSDVLQYSLSAPFLNFRTRLSRPFRLDDRAWRDSVLSLYSTDPTRGYFAGRSRGPCRVPWNMELAT